MEEEKQIKNEDKISGLDTEIHAGIRHYSGMSKENKYVGKMKYEMLVLRRCQ